MVGSPSVSTQSHLPPNTHVFPHLLHDVLPRMYPALILTLPSPTPLPSPPSHYTGESRASTMGMQGTRTARCGRTEDDGKVGCEQEGRQGGGEEEEKQEMVAWGEGMKCLEGQGQAVLSERVVGSPLCSTQLHPPNTHGHTLAA
jgi:hypothetical protein